MRIKQYGDLAHPLISYYFHLQKKSKVFHYSSIDYVSPGILAEGGKSVALRVGTRCFILKEKRTKNGKPKQLPSQVKLFFKLFLKLSVG